METNVQFIWPNLNGWYEFLLNWNGAQKPLCLAEARRWEQNTINNETHVRFSQCVILIPSSRQLHLHSSRCWNSYDSLEQVWNPIQTQIQKKETNKTRMLWGCFCLMRPLWYSPFSIHLQTNPVEISLFSFLILFYLLIAALVMTLLLSLMTLSELPISLLH